MSKEKPIICFDATELDNFEMCQFRWYAFHQRHIRPKATESYFEKGTLIHYLLELYYKSKLNNQVMSNNQVSETNLEEIVEKGRVKALDFDLSLEDVAEHIFQFREYIRYYQDENIIPLHVEESFTVELYEDDNLQILISGKPDLIFKYGSSSNICVMDHKRMSREFPYSPLRNQFLLYATAVQTDTVLINKVGFQKTKKPSERFTRAPFVYSQEILDEWKEDVINRAKEMLMAIEYQKFPRNRTSCEKWNGCYLQRYCATRPSAREFLIGEGREYRIGEEWDVGLKLEKVGE